MLDDNQVCKITHACIVHGINLHLLSYFVCTVSEGSGEASQMCRLTRAVVALLCDKCQNLVYGQIYDNSYESFIPSIERMCVIAASL